MSFFDPVPAGSCVCALFCSQHRLFTAQSKTLRSMAALLGHSGARPPLYLVGILALSRFSASASGQFMRLLQCSATPALTSPAQLTRTSAGATWFSVFKALGTSLRLEFSDAQLLRRSALSILAI